MSDLRHRKGAILSVPPSLRTPPSSPLVSDAFKHDQSLKEPSSPGSRWKQLFSLVNLEKLKEEEPLDPSSVLGKTSAWVSEEKDKRRERKKKGYLVLAGLFTIFYGIFMAIQTIVEEGANWPVISLSLCFSACFFGLLLRFTKDKQKENFVRHSLVMYLVFPLMFQIGLRESAVSGPLLLWSTMAPLGAVFVFPSENSNSWFIAFIVSHLVSISVDAYVRSTSIEALFDTGHFLLFSTLVFYTFKSYVHSLRSMSKKLAVANTFLRSHNRELNSDKKSLVQQVKNQKNHQCGAQSKAEKIITIMQKLKKVGSNDQYSQEIEFVIQTLAAGNVYTPDINQVLGGSASSLESVDSSMKEFIMNHTHIHNNHCDHEHATRIQRQQSERIVHKNCRGDLSFHSESESRIPSEVHSILDKINEWNLEIFDLDVLTGGRPLYFMGQALFRFHNLIDRFQIDQDKLHHFLQSVEASYHRENAYHNNIHAADVAQTLNFFITKGGVGEHLTSIDILGAIVAALVHDADHPGVNNHFEISTSSPRAMIYNDVSVLENHHTSVAFKILSDSKNDIFSTLPNDLRKELRSTIIDMVLATDFSKHLEIVGQFNAHKAAGDFDPTKREHKILMLKMAIKCADISHTSKKSDLHLNWTERVTTEFYNQGDREKSSGLPVSSFMDRLTPNIPKSQFGFINFLVAPMMESFVQQFPKAKVMYEQMNQNLSHWKTKMDQ